MKRSLWSGTAVEATLVADEEAAVYEEKQTGISSATRSGTTRSFGCPEKKRAGPGPQDIRAAVGNLVLAVLAAVFLFQYFPGPARRRCFRHHQRSTGGRGRGGALWGRRRKAVAICNNPKIAAVQMEIFPMKSSWAKGKENGEIPWMAPVSRGIKT